MTYGPAIGSTVRINRHGALMIVTEVYPISGLATVENEEGVRFTVLWDELLRA